jgi:NAD(P)-dependent dehydrogenase (short-subunit alcohol dehydrogenase family)
MEKDFEVGLNMINLSGKEAIVTGGGSGVGRGIYSVLVLAGANVLGTDISEKSAEDTPQHCGSGNKLKARQMDVTNENSVDEIVSEHIRDRKKSQFGGSLKTEGLEGKKLFDQTVKTLIPLQREQAPEYIGNMVAFLASDLAENITGQSINVGGGRFTN